MADDYITEQLEKQQPKHVLNDLLDQLVAETILNSRAARIVKQMRLVIGR